MVDPPYLRFCLELKLPKRHFKVAAFVAAATANAGAWWGMSLRDSVPPPPHLVVIDILIVPAVSRLAAQSPSRGSEPINIPDPVAPRSTASGPWDISAAATRGAAGDMIGAGNLLSPWTVATRSRIKEDDVLDCSLSNSAREWHRRAQYCRDTITTIDNEEVSTTENRASQYTHGIRAIQRPERPLPAQPMASNK